jgi:hypothetical protein
VRNPTTEEAILNRRWMVVLLPLLLVPGACGDAEQSSPENVRQTIESEVAAATGQSRARGSSDNTPCEILDDALIRASFDVPEGVEISRQLSSYSSHPMCTVSWPKPNADEIESTTAAAMMDYIQKQARGEKAAMPSFRTTDEVTLTLTHPPFKDADAAVSGFDSAMKILTEGMTITTEGVSATVQADGTPVAGVGQKAMWVPKYRQLSVVDGNRMFHLGVNTGSELDEELETAKEIAKKVARQLWERG